VRLPLQTYLYSATAAAVVKSPMHEPCSVYYFASCYVRQKVSCSFVSPLAPDSSDTIENHPHTHIRLTWRAFLASTPSVCNSLPADYDAALPRSTLAKPNNCSAVAEMGDRGHSRHGPKIGGLLCPFAAGAGSSSSIMWPGLRSTSVLSGILIHPAIWPQ